jgi:hypothetical protein
MSSNTQSRRSRLAKAAPLSYWAVSKRPLQILVFLLPLIIAYELGLALVLRSDEGVLSTVAHIRLLQFFEFFGINAGSGLLLGGIAIVVVLFIWHFLARDPWEVDFKVLGMMAVESIILTLPLIVFGQLIVREAISAALPGIGAGVSDSVWGAGAPLLMAGTGAEAHISDLDLWSRLSISIGAGLYEELLFRMILLAALHTLLVDVGKASHKVGATVAVIVSAAAFTAYHPLQDSDGNLLWSRLVFYFVAGLYFGAVYVARGFGIVVAVHVLYDVVMVTAGPAE